MFKNISSPVMVGALRGLIVGLIAGLSSFGILYGSGATSRIVVSGVIGAMVPVWLGFLGYGAYDANRAATGTVHASDVQPKVGTPAVSPVMPINAPVVPPASSSASLGVRPQDNKNRRL